MNPDQSQSVANRVIAALKSIGRGHAGSRDMSLEQSTDLFEAIFNGQVGDLELGAILLALRVKGESLTELQGAMAALENANRKKGFLLETDPTKPIVVIPSYNGARLQANLTPLLACVLADAGVQVIVHGVETDSHRITSAEIFADLGIAPVQNTSEVMSHLARQVPAFVPIRLACPPLAALLALRSRMGVRNIAHTLAKMFNPTDRRDAIRLTAFTHPEFNTLQHNYFVQSGATAFVMRATEGECVANTRRQQPIDVIKGGVVSLVVPGQTTAPADLPPLPPAQDAIATARWIQSVLAGELELPASIAEQSRAILKVCNG